MHLSLALLALLFAVHAAHAVTYGAAGTGSQYQLFGRPIQDTPSGNAIPIRSGVDTTAFAVIEGEPQKHALQAKACDKDFVYSEVFSKCLPAPGKDGYIGKATDETAKGKGVAESAFVPISAQTYAMHAVPLPLRAQPLSSTNAEQPPQQSHPPGNAGTQIRSRAVAPVRQLRLACPPGFGFSTAIGACIAPAANMMGPAQLRDEQQAMRMRIYRPRDGEDDEDDGDNSDERDNKLRRQRMRLRLRHHRMFGHRFGFGGACILAPVFVFVLPPLDRNATRLGIGFGERVGGQRVHEVHPSMVGPIGSAGTQSQPPTAAAPAKPEAAPKEKPIEAQPTPGPKTTTGTGPAAPKALPGAFVNPIVGSGKTLPLKSQTTNWEPMRVDAGVDDRAMRHDEAAPLKADESSITEPLLKRHAFVSPFVALHAKAA